MTVSASCHVCARLKWSCAAGLRTNKWWQLACQPLYEGMRVGVGGAMGLVVGGLVGLRALLVALISLLRLPLLHNP